MFFSDLSVLLKKSSVPIGSYQRRTLEVCSTSRQVPKTIASAPSLLTYNSISNKTKLEKDILTALPSDLLAAENYHEDDNIPFITPPVHYEDGEVKDDKGHPEDEVGFV